jgi:hypothetical protein
MDKRQRLENTRRIIEACDTVDYEYSYRYKEAALQELDDIEYELEQVTKQLERILRGLNND